MKRHARDKKLAAERLEDRRLLTGIESNQWVLDPATYDASSILVRLSDDMATADAGSVPLRGPLPILGMVEIGQRLLPGLQRVRLPADVSVQTALKALRSCDGVAYAEPVYRIRLQTIPDDPRFDEQWGLHNDGQSGGAVDADVDAPEAWDALVGSGHTIVAVIDTGVDYTHPDLQANMWVNADEVAADGLDNDGNGFIDDVHGYDFANHDGDPLDDNNHGTHVAGTIAAVGNNGIGVTGVNWRAQIMALKFLNAQGSGDTDDAIEALNYAVANGATISNNSWGYSGGFSQALYEAIDAARAAQHVFVAAAGNGNFLGIGSNNDTTPFWPSSFDLDNIISVAAVDHNDTKPLFSNYGATSVDLAAPGVDILSTYRNGTYGYSTGTSMAAPHVAGVVALVRDQHPDWSYAQAINQVLQTVDPISAMQGITTTGGRVNAAAAVGVELIAAPDVQVLFGSQNLTDEASMVDYGSTPPGLPIDYTFTVKNRGIAPLNLTEPIEVPAGFSVLASFGATTLNVGATTTFAVRLDAVTEGTYAGTVRFLSDDPDESPFNFTLTGIVAVPPAVQISDNGDATFETTGQWTLWTGQGYQNDVHESLAGTGADIARWEFDRLLPGMYRVAATWTAYTNRATNSPFTISDDNTPLGTVAVNQQVVAAGFSAAGATWQYLGGPYHIAGHTLTVALSDAANGRVNADAIRIERLDTGPEIAVWAQGTEVADNSGVVAFNPTTTGTPASVTFTVQNLGAIALILDEPIEVPAGFSLVSGFGAATLAADQTTTFTIALTAVSAGQYNGAVTFGTSDPDESPFNFAVEGSVTDPPKVQIVDNGDLAFTTVGDWTRWTRQGYQNDVHESLAGTGSDVATWKFAGLLPGTYRIAATWTKNDNRASNAPFSVLDGDHLLTTSSVNQKLAPGGFSTDGVTWQYLCGAQSISSGTLSVRLSDAADGRVNADAVRIERLDPAPEIQVTQNAVDLPDGTAVVNFGNTTWGAPITKTFVVTNHGGAPLHLRAPISVPAGFSVVSSFSSTTLGSDDSATLVIQADAVEAGVLGGTVAFGTDDEDENPFDFSVQATVVLPPAVTIIDNGDAGFSTGGTWSRWTGQGYLNDVHESLAGTGADVATWTFTNLLPGVYRVSATWTTYTNRATNSPFTVLDGARTLATVTVNQRVAPSEFLDSGVLWNDLGTTYQIESGTLTVRLTDAANGRVNADAIRIERLDGSQ
jgi:subtilisin family serine protease